MEDGPILKLRLSKHLALDLSIDFTSTLFNVKTVRSAAGIRTHQETTSVVLKALEFLGVLIKLQVPKLLLLDALFVCLEMLHQVLNLLNLGICISVNDLCKILHKTEVSTHSISQPSQLTEFRNKSDLISRSPVLVDEQRLIWFLNSLVVAGLIVVTVTYLSALFIEAGLGTLAKVNTIDLVRLLIVLSDDSRTGESLLDGFVAILVAPFSILSNFLHVLQHSIGSDDFEAHIDIEETALLLLDQTGVEAGPNSDVVSIERMCRRLVERFLTYSLKSKTAHHRVKEDLKEIHVIPIMLLHDLNPLDANSVLDTIMLGSILR
jgi:hypothetical protein